MLLLMSWIKCEFICSLYLNCGNQLSIVHEKLLSFDVVKPLFGALFDCVQIVKETLKLTNQLSVLPNDFPSLYTHCITNA